MNAVSRLEEALSVLAGRDRLRQLIPAEGLDFASNDYLGLAGSELMADAARAALLRGVPVGSGGSRLLRGNHAEHELLEAEAALFFGSEAALFMAGGFQANQAIFATLPGAGDLVLHDTLIHASAIEGMRLGRADTRAFAHNDVTTADAIISDWRRGGGRGQVWIAVESVYSMEGDIAPLEDLAALARRHDAILVVDEAHATGVWGARGRGLAHSLAAEVLTVHTCGKGLGVSGALICGARAMIDMLVNRARTFLFSTAPSPLTAALVRAALVIVQTHSHLQQDAKTRIAQAHRCARDICGIAGLHSQIIPIVLGSDRLAMQRARALRDAGFDVRGIRPPTVPRGTARLRVSITANVRSGEIEALFRALAAQQEDAA